MFSEIFPAFSVYRTFSGDPLHAIEQGKQGKHAWPWLLEKILSDTAKQELNSRYVIHTLYFLSAYSILAPLALRICHDFRVFVTSTAVSLL